MGYYNVVWVLKIILFTDAVSFCDDVAYRKFVDLLWQHLYTT
jgi:hypothetical protein